MLDYYQSDARTHGQVLFTSHVHYITCICVHNLTHIHTHTYIYICVYIFSISIFKTTCTFQIFIRIHVQCTYRVMKRWKKRERCHVYWSNWSYGNGCSHITVGVICEEEKKVDLHTRTHVYLCLLIHTLIGILPWRHVKTLVE